jgi:nicotinamide-nucleotide amidase
MEAKAVHGSAIENLVQEMASLLTAKQFRLATAESCSGGGIASACTDLSGSSVWFTGGIVSYSNQIKQQLLQVPESIITNYGAVSAECAAAMASGAMKAMATDIAVSTTGIAGPTGGSSEKPVGMVCFGIATANNTWTDIQYFTGDRYQVRQQTIAHALTLLVNQLNDL